MSSNLLIVLALVGAPRWARGERPIHVDAAGAPFAAEELVAALRVRIAAEGGPVRIRVIGTEGGVRIESRGAVREVALAELRGSDAARLVALAVDDLLLDDLALPPPALPPVRRVTIGVLGGAAAWGGTLGGLAADVVVPRGEYVLAVEAGGARLFSGPIAVTAADVRASAGVRVGWLELRAGLTVVPVFVTTGVGDATVLVGGGASARVLVPVSDGLHAVIGGGLDVFATRTEYRIAGMPTMTTPRWSPWAVVGVEVPL